MRSSPARRFAAGRAPSGARPSRASAARATPDARSLRAPVGDEPLRQRLHDLALNARVRFENPAEVLLPENEAAKWTRRGHRRCALLRAEQRDLADEVPAG